MPDQYTNSWWDTVFEGADPYSIYELTDKGREQAQVIKEMEPKEAWKRIMSGPPAQIAFYTFLIGLDRGMDISETYNLLKSRGTSEEPIREGLASLIQHRYIEDSKESF